MDTKPEFGEGILHCPEVLLPQAAIEPSVFRPTECHKLVTIAAKPEFGEGILHSPLKFFPQATTEPSAFRPRECSPPAAIAMNLSEGRKEKIISKNAISKKIISRISFFPFGNLKKPVLCIFTLRIVNLGIIL